MINEFKTGAESWDWYASREHILQCVLDPAGDEAKNNALDKLHKDYILSKHTFKPTDKILDFACGVGRLSEWLAPQVKSILAIDTNLNMIARAINNSKSTNVSYHYMRLDQVKGKFDVALAIFILQYCNSEEKIETMKLLNKLAKKVIVINHGEALN